MSRSGRASAIAPCCKLSRRLGAAQGIEWIEYLDVFRHSFQVPTLWMQIAARIACTRFRTLAAMACASLPLPSMHAAILLAVDIWFASALYQIEGALAREPRK